MKNAGPLIAGVAALGIIVIAAVAINVSHKTDGGYAADTSVSHPSPVVIGAPIGGPNATLPEKQQRPSAPDFLLKTIDGTTISVAQFKGKKPAILDFFATWCPNCRRDIPNLVALSQKYKDSVQVIGVDLQEDPSTVSAFARQLGISYPVALDPNSQASQSYAIGATNVHVLIGKDGALVRTVPGDISESDFTSLIQ